MRTKIPKPLTLLVWLPLALFGSCDWDPLKDISVVIDPQIMEFTAMIEVFDARTGAPLGPNQNTVVRFEGDLAGEVLNNNGKRTIDIVEGRISIGIHPRVKITGSDFKKLTVVVEATGYLQEKFTLYFGQNYTKNQWLTLPVMNIQAPPPGVSLSDTGIVLGAGATTLEPFSCRTGQGGLSNNHVQNITLNLDSGTSFIDESGSTVRTGNNLQIQIESYDTGKEPSMSFFPSSFSPNGVLNLPLNSGNPTSNNIYFVTGGFGEFNMQIENRKIKAFTKPLTVEMEMDPATVNPHTGNPIGVGDSIQVWSFNSVASQWSYEKTAAINLNPITNKLQVSYTTTHLSWYNIAWYGSQCQVHPGVLMQIPNYPPGISNLFWIEFTYPGTNRLVTSGARLLRRVGNGDEVVFYGAPGTSSIGQVLSMEAKVYNFARTELLATTTVLGCGTQGTATLNLPAPFVCDLDVTGICADKPYVLFKPSFPLYYRKTNSGNGYAYLGYVSNGLFRTIDLDSGVTYDFRSYFNGRTYDSTLTVQQRTFVYSIEMGAYCSNF